MVLTPKYPDENEATWKDVYYVVDLKEAVSKTSGLALTKLGITSVKRLKARLEELNRAAPHGIKVVRLIHCRDAATFEAKMKAKYHDYMCASRSTCEWFEFPKAQYNQLLDDLFHFPNPPRYVPKKDVVVSTIPAEISIPESSFVTTTPTPTPRLTPEKLYDEIDRKSGTNPCKCKKGSNIQYFESQQDLADALGIDFRKVSLSILNHKVCDGYQIRRQDEEFDMVEPAKLPWVTQ